MQTNKILPITVGLVVVAGLVFWARHEHATPIPSLPRVATATPAAATPLNQVTAPAPVTEMLSPASAHGGEENSLPAPATTVASAPIAEDKPAVDEAFEQTVNLLVSPQASFQQKQTAWGQLRNAGQISQAIAALEQRQTADPTSAEIPTQLGMAYLIAISTTQDVREQGIGGMKADLSFDAALKLDPTNWEAGFMKASALSHWPDSMKMGPQVIQRFATLIDQQEAQPVRPEFVQSYVLLGDQYQKSGQADEARQAWARGLNLFPANQTLAQRLNPTP